MLPLATARWLLGRTCILPPGRLAGGAWLSTASPVRWGLVTGRRCIVGERESLGVLFSLFSGYEKMLAGVQGGCCGAVQTLSWRAASWRCNMGCHHPCCGSWAVWDDALPAEPGHWCLWLDRRTRLCYVAQAAADAAVTPQCLGDSESLGPAGPQLRVDFLEMKGDGEFWGPLGLLPWGTQRSHVVGTCFYYTCAL